MDAPLHDRGRNGQNTGVRVATFNILNGRTPTDRLTFPTDEPTMQLDHILVMGRLHAVSGGPVGLPVSDHLALVADLQVHPTPG